MNKTSTKEATDIERRIEQTAELFRAYVEQKGHFITPDSRVHEKTAADLLGLSSKRLRALRSGLLGPTFIKMSGTVWYRLNDIAGYVERSRNETVESILMGK